MRPSSNNEKQMSGKQQSQPQASKQKAKKIRKIGRRRSKVINVPEINDPDFEWDSKEQFEVEKIIKQEIWNGRKYYFVKWKGFDISMSTWQDANQFKKMKDLLEDFQRRKKRIKKHKSINEVTDQRVNPYKATEFHGHFLYGDKPRQIIRTLVDIDESGKKRIYHEVVWQRRKTSQGEVQLWNSILQSDVIFDHNPKFLLDYYQNSITLKPKCQ